MAKKRKEVALERENYRTVWYFEDDEVHVNVYRRDETDPILEWAYPKMPGIGRSLMGQAMVWVDQAVLEAKHQNG